MPRLVLFEDDGRQVMASEISREVFSWLERLVQLHGGSMRTVAAAVRIGRALLAAPASPPARRVAAARGKRGGHA